MAKLFPLMKVVIDFKPIVDSWVFKLHYRYTYIVVMVSALLSTLYDIGGNKIDCLVDKKFDPYKDSKFLPFKAAVNNYCFITGTFTVQRPLNSTSFPHPGMGPVKPGDDVTVHSYYQWVPFVLFLQGVMFYVPHWLWKVCEGGIFKQIIQDLSIRDYLGSNLENYFRREDSQDPETRWDPMSLVFPKLAKCTFRTVGPSGTVQVLDTMCVLAMNIVNEKIYLFLWVWLVLLTAITSFGLLLRLLTLLSPAFRKYILTARVQKSARKDLDVLLRRASISDWFLLLSLAKNMERSVFSELVVCLQNELSYNDETPPMSEEALKL